MRPARVLFTFLAILAGLLFVLDGTLRQSLARTEEAALTPCCGQTDETAPRQLQFPYYSLRDGFESSVFLVSASGKPFEFVTAVRSRSGRTVLLPAVTIQPAEKPTLDLRSVLTEAGADVSGDFSEGSVAVYFQGTIMPLAGQLTMTDPLRGLSMESEMVDNTPGLGLLPPVLNAAWWGIGGGRDAQVMVSNTTGEPATAEVILDFLGERNRAKLLTFGPHETKVLSITQLLGELKFSPAQAAEGGITIIPRGPKPTLVAQGRITDAVKGFSSTLSFPLPELQLSSALHASGVPGTPTKDSPYAGLGTFVPHVIVRNLLGAPQAVTVTVEYPGARPSSDGRPEEATSEEPSDEPATQLVPLTALTLGSYETRDISLDDAFGLLPGPLPFCSIRIQHSGPPGSLMAEVSSIEAKGDLVIDSPVANEGDGWAGSGANPWRLDDETESVMFLTNMADRSVDIGFQVQAGGVSYYLTDLSLKPRETRAIDLRKLRDAQEADFQGNKIPAGATDGSVHWIRLDNLPVMGRVVVLKRHQRLASSGGAANVVRKLRRFSMSAPP